jgi:hypothetical protein
MCQVSNSENTVNTNTVSLLNKRSVSWNEEVNVKRIPSHRDYGELVKACLYMSPYELWLSQYRSMIELTVDGPDWRLALEEDCMPVDMYTGERFHPAHLMDLNLPSGGKAQQERQCQDGSKPSQPFPPETADHCLQELCALLG